ncbi:uncharacterized protein SCODWIG_01308 [Saccharomycodes ludwigii]|uniref:Major facilitator superfamily (MFS) profile domain-containing protein n=1 Tax=Saccharomycodes ludwigii TaxID=36035 RepID=A0A376B4C9_9ASCO|nr:hypothetical protein SCDLUD_001708 [Saccharomycodes ludwigii]KAH3901924.1 hypothetical protein SCDLUD_001708 [Saccharomycodes ludwigii]SSD59547.1 uncharacterized protein SCODWIG_01308 [Saccharomycodes ludwigii]
MGRKKSSKTNRRNKLKAFTRNKNRKEVKVESSPPFLSTTTIVDSNINTISMSKSTPESNSTSPASSTEVIHASISENTPLIQPIRSSIVQDVSTDIPGFVAAELEEQEEEYIESQQQQPSYSAINSTKSQQNTIASIISTDDGVGLSKTRVQIILWSMYLGIFLASLDVTIVSTLLGHISSEFNALSRSSWIATAYLLSNATFQPLYGKISDIFGRKPLLIFSNVCFSIGCWICGRSGGLWWLVLGRFISGIGGGGMTSMSTITTSDLVPLRSRAFYQGVGNFFFGLGTAIGGLIGGWISDKFGWRWAFYVQVPLSVLSTLSIIIFMDLPPTELMKSSTGIRNKLSKIDWYGSLTLVCFLLFFMIASSIGGKEVAFSSNTFIGLCCASFVCFILFMYIELKVSCDPVLPMKYLADRSVFGASFANWFCMMNSITLLYYLPIYWSTVLDLSPTETGKRLSPNFFSTAFGSLGAGLYIRKTGKYYWFQLLFCIWGVLGCLKIYLITPKISVLGQYLLFVTPGFGMSVLITVTLLVIIAAVPKEAQATCTSISYMFRSTGSTLGVSIGAAIFRKSISSLLVSRVMEFEGEEHTAKELYKIIDKATNSSEYLKIAPDFVKDTLKECYHSALKNTYLFCLVCFILATVSVSIVREYKLHTSMQRDEEESERD